VIPAWSCPRGRSVRAAVKTLALALGLLGSLAPLRAAGRWKIQYLYDHAGSNFDIRDVVCPSPQHCVAAGVITDQNDRRRGAVVLTSDGGRHWSQFEVKELPLSLFFLDETTGWMVTDHGLWSAVEGGRSWNRVEDRKGILQAYFLNANHGYIAGTSGLLDETLDGGKTWAKLPQAGSASSAAGAGLEARAVSFDSLTFQGPHGIIIGEIDPSAPLPKGASRSALGHVVVLETLDGGKNWNTSSVPLDAGLGRLRLSKQGFVLALLVYTEGHSPLASAVFQAVLGEPRARMVFGERDRTASDVALLDDGRALVVAVEPPGNSPQVPIPGKLKILESRNIGPRQALVWREMDVDYRALAQAAVIAVADPGHMWVATDTGAILGLVDAE
jgi:Photosynthesis system II assembly factor YCF48